MIYVEKSKINGGTWIAIESDTGIAAARKSKEEAVALVKELLNDLYPDVEQPDNFIL